MVLAQCDTYYSLYRYEECRPDFKTNTFYADQSIHPEILLEQLANCISLAECGNCGTSVGSIEERWQEQYKYKIMFCGRFKPDKWCWWCWWCEGGECWHSAGLGTLFLPAIPPTPGPAQALHFTPTVMSFLPPPPEIVLSAQYLVHYLVGFICKLRLKSYHLLDVF